MGNNLPNNKLAELHNHERLGPIKILETYDQQLKQVIQSMQMQIPLVNEKIVYKWQTQMRKIDDTEIRQVILLPQKYDFQKDGMCGSSGTLHVTFDNFPYTLTGQINNRHMLKKYFIQKQVWYLLYNLIRGATKFHRNNIKIGNIHSDNILINDVGQIKIISTCSLPNQKNNFQLVTQNIQSRAFLAPEQLSNDAVKISQYPLEIDPCIAQVFSIGLTILSAGTLFDCSDVYRKHKQTLKLDKTSVDDFFDRFRMRYGPFLSDVVGEMINFNTQHRKCSYDIYSMLYRHETEILQLEPFPQPESYTKLHKVHKTGNDFTHDFTFPSERPQFMDPLLKPQVWLGSQKQIISPHPIQHIEQKINSPPVIPIKPFQQILFTNISPRNHIANPQLAPQRHYVSRIKIPAQSMTYDSPNISPRVRFQRAMKGYEIRRRPEMVQKVLSPILKLRKEVNDNIQSTMHMRYSKSPSSNMLSTAHIYVHPPHDNKTSRSIQKKKTVAFSFPSSQNVLKPYSSTSLN